MKTWEKVALGAGVVGGGFLVGWFLRCAIAPCGGGGTSPTLTVNGKTTPAQIPGCCAPANIRVSRAPPNTPLQLYVVGEGSLANQGVVFASGATDASGNFALTWYPSDPHGGNVNFTPNAVYAQFPDGTLTNSVSIDSTPAGVCQPCFPSG